MSNSMEIPGAGLTPQNYRFLQEHIYRSSGIVLDGSKSYLMEARLMPIVAQQRLATLNDLCALLRSNCGDKLHRDVIEAMTTNETMFFRDSQLWQALKDTVLPRLISERKNFRRLRFWSAASSSGQEAYSLAMMLLEMGLSGWDIQILGTDLSQQMIERARSGKYAQLEVNRGLPASYLVKYLIRDGIHWQLKDEVRRLVQFTQLDLRQKLSNYGPFDIVFCRNVMIYFDVPTKQRILKEIRGTLSRGGYLLLGSAETTLNLDDSFERKSFGQATFYQVV